MIDSLAQKGRGHFVIELDLPDAAGEHELDFAATDLFAGFLVKPKTMITQFKDAQGVSSKQLSTYMQGFSNAKYSTGMARLTSKG